jgi:hypothetical protein
MSLAPATSQILISPVPVQYLASVPQGTSSARGIHGPDARLGNDVRHFSIPNFCADAGGSRHGHPKSGSGVVRHDESLASLGVKCDIGQLQGNNY